MATGKFQAFFAKDRVGEKSFNEFVEKFDIGDFIQIRGILFDNKKKRKNNPSN
jgi:lysyl-tRNA synthetase class 2